MNAVDMSPGAITARMRLVGQATDLRPAARLACKVDMSPPALTRRLRQVSELRRLCLKLGQLKERPTA